MLTAGIGFNIGRSRTESSDEERRARERGFRPRERELGDRKDRDEDRAKAEREDRDHDERMRELHERELHEREQRERTPHGDRARRRALSDSMTAGGRVITLPVPVRGEIYVRYGPEASRLGAAVIGQPGLDSLAPLRGMRQGLTEDEMDEIVNRLTTVLERMLDQRDAARRPELERARPEVRDSAGVERRDRQEPALEAARPAPLEADSVGGIRIRSVSPYGGVSFGSVSQLVVGVRADAGPALALDWLRLVPQMALGFGEETSVHAGLGLQALLPTVEVSPSRLLHPHVRLGFGALWVTGDGNSRAGLDFSYGVTLDRPGRLEDDDGPRVFLEHQGIDAFAVNRFVVGLTWRR
jgi:hypothetical protein